MFTGKYVSSESLDKLIKVGNFYGKITKRLKGGSCRKCDVPINKGDTVLVVDQRNGYIAKHIGLCHIDCFDKFKNETK